MLNLVEVKGPDMSLMGKDVAGDIMAAVLGFDVRPYSKQPKVDNGQVPF